MRPIINLNKPTMLNSKITISKSLSILLLFFILSQLNVIAQVGIATTDPQEQLHIAGSNSTIRIEGLNASNNSNNNGITESPVYVDSYGDLVLKPQYPKSLVSKTGTDFIPTPTVVSTYDGDIVYTTLANGNFTTSKNGMVSIEYSVGASEFVDFDGLIVADGAPRVTGIILYIDGVLVSRSSQAYNNLTTVGGIASGILVFNNSRMINLSSGLHTYKIEAFVFGNTYAFESTFGDSGYIDRLGIVEF